MENVKFNSPVYLIGYFQQSVNDLRSGREDYSLEISTIPGETNISHQPLTDGWLGCTCNVNANALGEFYELDELIEEIQQQDFELTDNDIQEIRTLWGKWDDDEIDDDVLFTCTPDMQDCELVIEECGKYKIQYDDDGYPDDSLFESIIIFDGWTIIAYDGAGDLENPLLLDGDYCDEYEEILEKHDISHSRLSYDERGGGDGSATYFDYICIKTNSNDMKKWNDILDNIEE